MGAGEIDDMKVIHSADWQLGARFSQFGEKADFLRAVRLETLHRALKAARDRGVDAFVVAGDLFEDNQVENSVIDASLDAFAEFPEIPVFLLPGNHDPFTGPDSVWNRRQFQKAPANVRVFQSPAVHQIADGYLLASPLGQKVSTVDPSLKLVQLARSVPAEAVKMGFTHGALAIPGKHQPNDFPIHLEAATRAGLDYLGIGHWHNWQAYDGGRMIMPGTPEPDQFEQDGSGQVAFVEIKERGAEPLVEKISVASLAWRTIELDLSAMDGNPAAEVERALATETAARARQVLRVVLSGAASPDTLSAVRAAVAERLDRFAVAQMSDRGTITVSEAEMQRLLQEHPLLAQVLADIAQLDHIVAGSPKPCSSDGTPAISLAEAQRLAVEARIDLAALDASHFSLARQLLFETLREVRS